MRLIGLLAAAALLLAGCGAADPVPKVPKQSASATPTATLPVMPAEAQKDSKAGAIAFVKHYIEVFNYASNTGDVKELKQLSDPKCEGCNSYIEHFIETYSQGGYLRDAGWQARDLSTSQSGKTLIVLATVDAPETTYRTTKTSTVKIGRSGVYDLYFEIGNGKIQKFERNEAPK